jgi:DNA invertase Pin-like site-specific DNA recombinase
VEQKLDLTGEGAAYLRVSDDEQDTKRQYAALEDFERRHGVKIAKHLWFKDEGWARDTADRRPDFQRLMKLAETGKVTWIVVDKLDRFGTKSAKQLFAYLFRLEEAGCRLYDCAGKEWTGEDDSTEITAWFEGKKAAKEPRDLSHRVLGGKVARAREGEWQGGPVQLGLDVACYSRATGAELWRIVFEDRYDRRVVYPDGRQKVLKPVKVIKKGNEKLRPSTPAFNPDVEVMRITPSLDRTKVDAPVTVFKRFATEAVNLTTLAHYLNQLGFRTSYGGYFQSHHIESMLSNAAYLGYYMYNRRHSAKYNRFKDGRVTIELNYDEKQSKNDKADWVWSRRLFEPLVSQKVWDAVQRKLDRPKRERAAQTPEQYLSRLVVCAGCGRQMVYGMPKRVKGKTSHVLFCGTYSKAVREGRRKESPCLRNAVAQDDLRVYIDRWLDETGHRLELLTAGHPAPTGKLEQHEESAWRGFREGIQRLAGYLAKHHPEEYARIIDEDNAERAAYEEGMTGNGHDAASSTTKTSTKSINEAIRTYARRQQEGCTVPDKIADGFAARCVETYRRLFDPAVVDAELAQLREEHDRLVDRLIDMPTQRAKDTVRARLAALDTRMTELEQQRQDAAAVVEQHWREMTELQLAIADAKLAMQDVEGEAALRQLAERLRAVIQRIEVTFAATGKTGGGPGKTNSVPTTVTIYPVVGDSAAFTMSSVNSIYPSTAHSLDHRILLFRLLQGTYKVA